MTLFEKLQVIHQMVKTRCQKGPLYANSDGELFWTLEKLSYTPISEAPTEEWMSDRIKHLEQENADLRAKLGYL